MLAGCVVEESMVEKAGKVEVIEEVPVLSHVFGVVLGDEFELVKELTSGHHLNFALELTDDVLELVVHQQGSVAFFGMLEDLISD